MTLVLLSISAKEAPSVEYFHIDNLVDFDGCGDHAGSWCGVCFVVY